METKRMMMKVYLQQHPQGRLVVKCLHTFLTATHLLKGFDAGIEELVRKIDTKYPAGDCSSHPGIQCFHHRNSGQHFELTRARKLTWAAHIVYIFLVCF